MAAHVVCVVERCCSLRGGVHDAHCPTDNEMQFYRCMMCDQPAWQPKIVFGVCATCAGSRPAQPDVREVAVIYQNDLIARILDLRHNLRGERYGTPQDAREVGADADAAGRSPQGLAGHHLPMGDRRDGDPATGDFEVGAPSPALPEAREVGFGLLAILEHAAGEKELPPTFRADGGCSECARVADAASSSVISRSRCGSAGAARAPLRTQRRASVRCTGRNSSFPPSRLVLSTRFWMNENPECVVRVWA
jgi:hypothetical protein